MKFHSNMSPRRNYTLGKRAVSVGETRRRIVEAAAACFATNGILATRFLEVARRADVAPATVSNHFASKDELAEAFVDHVIRLMEFPAVEIFDAVDDLEERIALLIDCVYESYRRSAPWSRMTQQEIDQVPALRAGAERLARMIGELQSRALGDLAADADVARVVGAALSAGFIHAMETSARDPEHATELARQLVMRWLSQHTATRTILRSSPHADQRLPVRSSGGG